MIELKDLIGRKLKVTTNSESFIIDTNIIDWGTWGSTVCSSTIIYIEIDIDGRNGVVYDILGKIHYILYYPNETYKLHNLKEIQKYLKDYCKTHKLPYYD